MTLEEQRKMLGADGDIERDCDRIAQEAARYVLDRTLFAPSIADLVDEAEKADLDDIDKQEIAKAIDLERDVEDSGEPGKMGKLAAWMEYSQDFACNEKDWSCAMLKWYAKAALAGAPAAISSIGRAFDGSFDEASMFADPEEENVDVEDERLIQDIIISAACELSAANAATPTDCTSGISTTWESTTKRFATGTSTRRWSISFSLSNETTKSTRVSYMTFGRIKGHTN